ncbi:MAG: UDP-N-acetylglucosamine 1-carboxyvinyltransferase [bacterium]
MASFIIEGKHVLQGDIQIAGNKNAALPIIAAALLTDEECVLENIPNIQDVDAMLAIVQKIGKSVERPAKGVVKISGAIHTNQLDFEEVRQLRASILFLGAVLSRTSEVSIAPPGGCVIGRRGLDSHFEALQELGAQIDTGEDGYRVHLEKPQNRKIFLREASVTATENVLLLTATLPGETVIENAACEPHISDFCQALQKMAVKIAGIGTHVLRVQGEKSLKGFHHKILPDHIEAGSFLIMAACTNSDLVIHGVNNEHVQMPCYFFNQMGLDFVFEQHDILHVHPSRLKAPKQKVQVGLWPGFPTDLMSPMIVMATQAEGMTLCHDWMYESRMFFVDKLVAMGAQITLCDPHRVIVTGPTPLRGQHLSTPDIRAGMALVIAALCARGESVIDNAELINRGYEDLVVRLSKLGAQIRLAE